MSGNADKPSHLEPEYAARFKLRSMADAYRHRAPYPPVTLEILLELISDTPRTLLDAGSGPGTLARDLVDRVDRIDAVDFSPEMIAVGRAAPNGDHPRLNWICGEVERASINPPYALITCGTSLHWMDLDRVMPRFRSALTDGGYLAIATTHRDTPWRLAERGVLYRFSTIRSFEPFDLVEHLVTRRLFDRCGHRRTAPLEVEQSIDDYIESYHSKERFCRESLGPEGVTAMGEALRELLSPYSRGGKIRFLVTGNVVWGRPV